MRSTIIFTALLIVGMLSTQPIFASALAAPISQQKQAADETLAGLFDTYFKLKDALVQSNEASANKYAQELATAVTTLDANELSGEAKTAWETNQSAIAKSANATAKATKLAALRAQFAELSTSLLPLVKVAQLEDTVYYQRCPMFNSGKGANWLSKEKGIKNPYYGKQMLTCGSITETISKQ